jgi:hypothetical protein
MQKMLLFLCGVLLGMSLVQTVETQSAALTFASFNGAAKALAADSSGDLYVVIK